MLDIDAYITNVSPTTSKELSSFTGDIDVFNSKGEMEIQIEGITVSSFTLAHKTDDRELYLQNVWDIDIMSGAAIEDDRSHSKRDLDLDVIAERVAHFYLRNLEEEFTSEEIPQLYRPLFNLNYRASDSISSTYDIHTREDWGHDTRDNITRLIEGHPPRVELELLRTLGDILPSILRGKTDILSQISAKSMIDRYLIESLALSRLNRQIGRIVKQIAHRHPRMNVLEISTGRGGLTNHILEGLGSAFSFFTLANTNTESFEEIQADFSEHNPKFLCRTLDIEQNIADQGFSDYSFDLVVSSYSFHAVKSVEQALQNIRQLVKPGGYILILEPTSDLLRFKFVMCGLPGSWSQGDDNPRLGTTVSPVKWDKMLRNARFAGIDSIIHDSRDPAKHTVSLMISQAVDEQIQMLRRPLQSSGLKVLSGELLIVGGQSLATSRIISNLSSVLFHCTGKITSVDSFEDLALSALSSVTAVLVLADLDDPVIRTMNPRKLKAIQHIFDRVRNVLWITQGFRADNPYHTATVGLGRCAVAESAHLRLQFLDVRVTENVEITIAESLLRLLMADLPEVMDNSRLWTTEHELVLEKGQLLIPRVLPIDTLNDRLNSVRRAIYNCLSPLDTVVEIMAFGTPENPVYTARQNGSSYSSGNSQESSVTIQVSHCTLCAVNVATDTYLHILIGSVVGKSEKVLGFSQFNASFVTIPNSWQLPCGIELGSEEQYLTLVTSYLVARSVVDCLPAGTSILYEPYGSLASMITSMLSVSDKHVIFLTTKVQPSSERTQWTTVHSHATKRMISLSIPPSATSFVNFSLNEIDSVNRIMECLPSTCAVHPQASVMQMESRISPKASLNSFELLTRAASISLDPDYSTMLLQSKVPVIGVSELVAGQQIESSFTIVNWSSTSAVTLLLEPVDPTTLFSGRKTYFLVGLTGDLGESLCRWMVLHGARYFVLSSR